MDKSSEGGEADTQQSQGKPQRYSKRLVNLMSGACSVAHSSSTAASASSHEDDIVTHHHKLRSHKRLSSSSSSRNTTSNSRKSTSTVSRNPSTESSTRSQTPNQHIENEHHHQGVGDVDSEVEILEEKRKGSSKADGRDCCGEQAAGGSDSSLLKSIISSSSCLPPTNETNELSQQAGLGGPTKRCKRTTATASSCSNNNSPLVTVSAPAQKDDADDDEPAAHVACARRASTQLSNDNGCIVETRSDSQSDNEMYQEDDDEVGPSCELPRKPSTSLSTTLTPSSPSSSQLSVGINLLNSAGNNNNNKNKNDASEKKNESRVGNNNGDDASFHESPTSNYYHHAAEVKIGECARENTQKKCFGDDGDTVKVKYCNEAQEQRGPEADEDVERRKNTSNAHDEQEDLDIANAKLQPPMSVIRRVVMPELQIGGGHVAEPLSVASLTKPKQLPSPSGVHSSKKPSRAKKSQSQQQSHSKASGRRGVVGLSSVHDTIPSSSSSSPSCSSVLLRNKVQLENNSNNNYNTRGGASGFSDNSSSTNSKQSVVEPKKPNIAPMLLMNNLPYMGELTFDTRPRRGRKPKKADICHLISKNYGIQFPVSYINLPNTGTGAQNLPHPSPILPLPQPSSKSSQHKRNNAAASIPSSVPLLSNSVASASSQMLPPPAFCNRDVSIVPIPSNWRGGSLDKSCSPQLSTSSTTGGNMKPLTLAQQLMLHPASAQQAISMFPLPSPKSNQSCQGKSMSMVQVKEEQEDEDEDEEQGGGQQCAENLKMETSSWDSDDTPLNLCLRDSSSMQDTEPLPLCNRARRRAENHDDIEEEEEDCEGVIGGGELHSLDVRWNKSVLLHGANATTRNSSSKRIPSTSSAVGMQAGNYGKRNMGGDGSKVCKSAKLSLRTSSHNSFSGSANNLCGDDVSSLVNQQRLVPTSSYSLSVNQQQQVHNFAVEQSAKSASDLRNSSTAATPPSSSPIFSITQHLKGPMDSGPTSGGAGKISVGGSGSVGVTGAKAGKQGGGSRKSKRETSTSNLRGDVSISVSSLPHHQLPCSSTNAAGNTAALSSIGGTLFGQSTSGINDAAEVSICKFKFTGGAKPCLQEKKMLSVDSGGNFRFYTDKTSGGGSKLAKNQQYPSSTSTSCSGSSPLKSHPPSGSDLCHSSEPECHFALSSLPKSAKSMSMCMSVPGSNPAVHVINSSSPSPTPAIPSSSKSRSPSRLSLPLIPSCSNSNPISSISPTTEELQQLRLIDSQSQANHPRSSSSVSPYHGGEFSYSSSNSCSSDNSNENPMVDGGSTYACDKSSGRLRSSSSCGSGGVHGNKLKMKRKRRTRKSLMREKLEKTFKEKGFLIQTQQLESAEGATYCKFRQLRKFTRYLFRSWKDYLPDHVKEISDNNNGQQQQQQRIEGLKSPGGTSGCSNQTDTRFSGTPGEGGDEGVLNLQSIEMDSNEFQDEDGDDDGEDDDLNEEDGDALISDGNDESEEEMEIGGRLSSSPYRVQKKGVEERDEEMRAPVLFDSSRELHSQHKLTASTSCFPESGLNHEDKDGHIENTNEGEEELQVDS